MSGDPTAIGPPLLGRVLFTRPASPAATVVETTQDPIRPLTSLRF